jgi:ribosomal protein L37E
MRRTSAKARLGRGSASMSRKRRIVTENSYGADMHAFHPEKSECSRCTYPADMHLCSHTFRTFVCYGFKCSS